jgi:hypothetical protein
MTTPARPPARRREPIRCRTSDPPPRNLRRRRALLAAAAAFLLSGFPNPASAVPPESNHATPESPALVTPGLHPHRVVAYYFHTNYRCSSCRAIEANALEAIESAFADRLKDGRLVWKVVNVETKGNEHFVKEYGLFTKSVILVNEVRGKRTAWKNLPKVWELLNDKPAFLKYVQREVGDYLGKTS